jgi:hypothetical protein
MQRFYVCWRKTNTKHLVVMWQPSMWLNRVTLLYSTENNHSLFKWFQYVKTHTRKHARARAHLHTHTHTHTQNNKWQLELKLKSRDSYAVNRFYQNLFLFWFNWTQRYIVYKRTHNNTIITHNMHHVTTRNWNYNCQVWMTSESRCDEFGIRRYVICCCDVTVLLRVVVMWRVSFIHLQG